VLVVLTGLFAPALFGYAPIIAAILVALPSRGTPPGRTGADTTKVEFG